TEADSADGDRSGELNAARDRTAGPPDRGVRRWREAAQRTSYKAVAHGADMSNTAKRILMVACSLVLLVVLAIAVPAGLFVADPMGVARWGQRQALSSALPDHRVLDGARGDLHTWRGGQGDGPTVVLVHGFADAGSGWTDVARRLAQHHRVMVVDLPGHGLSEPSGAPLAYADVSEGLNKAMESVQGPIVLVGNSMGGWLIMQHALDHPERVGRVIVVNGAGMRWKVDGDLLMPQTLKAIRAKNKVILGDATPDLPDFMLHAMIEVTRSPRYLALFDDLDASNGHHLDARLPSMKPAVSLIWGEGDAFFPHDTYAQRLSELLPGAPPVQTLPGCGHAPQYSCATLLADRIEAEIAI
ncbi:MAG: abhydrolase domain-containing protein 6, partial [Kiritimatiellia bacterium]